jgi:signal transduction histidine kinase
VSPGGLTGAAQARRRPSALVVLGVYSGVIAALAILPAAVPLLYRLVLAENRATTAEIYARTALIGHALEEGRAPALVGIRHVRAVTYAGQILLEDGDIGPDPALEDLVCGEPSGVSRVMVGNETLAAACYENAHLRVMAIWPNPTRSYLGIGAFVVALAAVAGLVTALGTLQVLRPLSKVSEALGRVGTGRRGVRMEMTGIAEVDELIARLNSAASAVEEREHNILARVQVVQEMARLVAHEVRNPLQSLELLTSLVAGEDDPNERRLLTANIHAEIRALDDVVTRLLREGAARGALRLQIRPCGVDELVQQLCAVRSAEAARKGARVVAQASYTGTADLDRPLFGRSIDNLLANAIRAVPSGDGLVRVDVASEGDQLVIRVEDNGPGVDPALGDAVFEPNVSGGGGTGLGLSLTKGVVEGHGGTIRLGRSDLGGASFELRVPLHAASGAAR